MFKNPIWKVIHSAIITAFTIAAALIWKDVIVEFIAKMFPNEGLLLYNFFAAILATLIVILFIYLFMKAESEAEYVVGTLLKKKGKTATVQIPVQAIKNIDNNKFNEAKNENKQVENKK